MLGAVGYSVAQRKTWEATQLKKRLTTAIAAAERPTMSITAIDSLSSCWRLGQTTSFSSLIADVRKLPCWRGSSTGSALGFWVSSEVGVVTDIGPLDVVVGAEEHIDQQIPYWTLESRR